jgi:hypothetical protein
MRLLRKSILAIANNQMGAMGKPHALRSLRPNRRQMDRQEVHQPDEAGALTISLMLSAPARVEQAGHPNNQ